MAALFYGCETVTAVKGRHSHTEDELPEIIVGCDDYPPFNYVNSDGQQVGIDIELATEAFRRMGYKAVFRTINWEEKKKLAESGEIDCIWSCFSIDGREDDYKWAGPYMTSHQVVAVKADSDIYNLSELAGKTVAVQSTTKLDEIFRDNEKYNIVRPGKIIAVQKRDLIYTFLSKGYVDAVAAHDTSIEQFMRQYNMEYRILDEPLQTVGLGVAFSHNDERGLNVMLTKTFHEMRMDGTTYSILGRYLDNVDRYLEVDDYEE